ncbi:alpha/beta fold hydrolase [Haloarchaeobius amylolyticus]|uniref:alpha/beta fold hydrolase n=1 Tax=Haloarchaeobius amylolyticus TaxID=1198296 RepID=UPI00226F538E|nr:alpha/beta hydrolase [Haloarchaeobius amylolyticus]
MTDNELSGRDGGTNPFASLYQRARDDLLTESVNETTVETRAGPTHVLTVGDAGAPPLVVFQGGNVTNPVTLAWVEALADEYHLVAPDTPGEPGLVETAHPPAFGPWVADVLDEMGIDSASMVGLSHGAGVLLEAAANVPGRIDAAALVVPAGFGVSFTVDLLRIVTLSLAYRVAPSERLLAAALAPLFTDAVGSLPPVVRETVGTALRTADTKTGFPGPDSPSELATFDAPTLLVGAEHDPFFRASWLHAAAAPYLPADTKALTFQNERHFLSTAAQARLRDEIRSFLSA